MTAEELREKALTIDCPVCHAAPRRSCRFETGSPMLPHLARMRAASKLPDDVPHTQEGEQELPPLGDYTDDDDCAAFNAWNAKVFKCIDDGDRRLPAAMNAGESLQNDLHRRERQLRAALADNASLRSELSTLQQQYQHLSEKFLNNERLHDAELKRLKGK